VRFVFNICGMSVETEGARVNHEMTCTGGASGVGDRRQCGRRNTRIMKRNYARYVRGCVGGRDVGADGDAGGENP
jgi:hypothetical protein